MQGGTRRRAMAGGEGASLTGGERAETDPDAGKTGRGVPERSHTFPQSHRIRTRAEFSAVFDARVRESRGPVMIWAAPNNLPHPRLGLSMGRKVGNAVRRNRIKRMLREAFRTLQHELPAGYDLVVTVRPHDPLPLEDYRKIVGELMRKLEAVWRRRIDAAASTAPPSPS